MSSFMFTCFVYRLVLIYFLLITLCFSSSQQLCHDHERSSLLQLKQSFIINGSASDDPSAYPKVSSWTREGETSDCCFWDGVDCNNDTGHVIKLDLSSSFLYGSIYSNSTLFNLFYLKRLNLADNHFNYSQIPTTINQLSRLNYLNLSMSGFSGQIPSEISTLFKLSSLDLSSNSHLSGNLFPLIENFYSLNELNVHICNISGVVPSSIGKLNQLHYLDLSYNNFRGEILSSLANLTQLNYLRLSYNDFTGEIPSSLTNLIQLNHLGLSYNNFRGKIPSSLTNLIQLNHLDLSYNNFRGKIPSSLANLTQLSFFGLSNNNFRGKLPSTLANLTQLNFLGLSNNNFSGKLPSTLANHTQLTHLSISKNHFTSGTLSWVCNLTKLNHMVFEDSNLTGRLPSCLGNLTQLTEINLRSNHLIGSVPQSLTRLTNLEILFLGYNDLSPTVSFDMFSEFKNLRKLDLSDYNLSVLTKTSINGSLQKLEGLELNNCSLSHFPDFLQYQENVYWLSLRKNQIHGQIPKWMLNMSLETLEYLDISSNFLTGFEQLPPVLPWVNLVFLDLHYNILKGPLPIPPSSTIIYRVESNALTGQVSPLICRLRSLVVLDLSNNTLSGALPQCLGNFSDSLSVLDLSYNSFSNNIPQTFTNRSRLKMIDLSYNQLQGQLPQSLANCLMLEYLILGNNQINDVFPYWLGSLPELQILVLRSNKFHGVIGEPQTKFEFQKLRIIDISHNSFTGKLPSEYVQSWEAMKNNSVKHLKYLDALVFFNLSRGNNYQISILIALTIRIKGVDRDYDAIQEVLSIIDLSSNKFEGKIPQVIGSLKGLHSLDLSNNRLSGDIPSSLGNLRELESLDLSQNKFSGEIPQGLIQLTFLQFFNVSFNRLTGPIPQGNQLSRFENTSYEGNLGLCGIPLPNKCGNSESEASTPSPSKSKQEQDSDSLFQFGWKVVLIGYAAGFVVGLFIGEIVIRKKHKWFAMTFRLKQPLARLRGL